MASLLSAAPWAAVTQVPSLNESLSGVFGSISLTAWICLLLPQLITNYKSQSADGLSMAFLFVWLLGDLANLSGALFTRLAPTAIAIGCYFVVADLVLISQCTYYNTRNARRARRRTRTRSTATEDSEDAPLLSRRRSTSLGLPGSHRRHSIRPSDSNMDALARIITGEDDTPDAHPWLHNTLSLLAVWIVGAAGYFVSYRIGAWDNAPNVPDPGTPEAQQTTELIGITLGYISAGCYLLARIPQILKNYREKSCQGLALLFFLLSMTGNFTYGASLVAYSQEANYLIKALPWLLGSLGTIVEDAVIFAQFRLYAPKHTAKTPDPEPVLDEDDSGYGAV